MMVQKKHDFGLILSLALIIAIACYWFVKEVPMDGVEHYVNLLGDKLMALVPKEKEKQELAAIYDEFKTRVKEKKIRPENVEQVASAIINLSNISDSVTFDEAKALIRLGLSEIPADSHTTLQIPDMKAVTEEWEALKERLSSVHQFEELLHDQDNDTPRRLMPRYRIDDNLNIIIDRREKSELRQKDLLKRLEEEKRLFWTDSVSEKMEKELYKLEIELESLSKGEEIKQNLLKLKILTQPIQKGIDIAIDSLDLVTIVNWDTLEDVVTKEIKKYESQKSIGSTAKPKD